ncbi:hypothetical protein ACFU93_42810 [Streptomyces sp. NPDC057611]|uniref:hypothetical protein n=1 Tax=Streptomyces sp. NPDC057611 TaxID=3346182 RepID=UPI0036B2B6B1
MILTGRAAHRVLVSFLSALQTRNTWSSVLLYRTTGLVALHGAVDAVPVSLVPTAVAAATGEDLVRALTTAPLPLPRPVVAVLPAQSPRVQLLPTIDEGSVRAYSDAEDAVRALAHAADACWLSRPVSVVPELPDVSTGRACELVSSFLGGNPEGGWLDPQTTAALLDCYGNPLISWAWARDENEAVAAAERLRGPDGRIPRSSVEGATIMRRTQVDGRP